jgi:hypothetical protein
MVHHRVVDDVPHLQLADLHRLVAMVRLLVDDEVDAVPRRGSSGLGRCDARGARNGVGDFCGDAARGCRGGIAISRDVGNEVSRIQENASVRGAYDEADTGLEFPVTHDVPWDRHAEGAALAPYAHGDSRDEARALGSLRHETAWRRTAACMSSRPFTLHRTLSDRADRVPPCVTGKVGFGPAA